MKKLRIIVAVLLLLGVWYWQEAGEQRVESPATRESPASSRSEPRAPSATSLPSFLPNEARRTLAAIAQGGPYPYRQDGGVFQNRERRLPSRERGYYREYTVDTPGSPDRGARRIITGGDPPVDYWYTDDHYRSFRAFQVTR
jgi:ribonuclease T1